MDPRFLSLFPASEADIPVSVRLPEPLRQTDYLAGGELRRWPGPLMPVLSPVMQRQGERLLQRTIGAVPKMDVPAALAVLDAAAAAWDHGRGAWPTAPAEERIRCLELMTEALRRQGEEIVRLLMWETGKSLDDSRMELERSLRDLRKLAEAARARDRDGSRFRLEEGVLAQVRRAPLGVVLCMGPYNYPLNETLVMLLPALLAGNTAIVKPPRHGALLWRPLLPVLREIFPPGVLNFVYGEGAELAPALLADGRVAALGYVGTSTVANRLRAAHPRPHRLRLVLGLEAKNVAIVLADADLELAARECIRGALAFNGQRCTAIKLLFVQRPVAAEFTRRCLAALADLQCGMPWQPGVNLTPLPEPAKPAYLAGLVADALSRGATVLNPGGGASAGSFFAPALVGPVAPGMRLWAEEQFGPVAPLAHFDRVEEVVDYLIEADCGQQLSLFGSDPQRIGALLDPLVNQVCRVNLNGKCQRNPDTFPFAGRKDSGEGPLSVPDALDAFSLPTLVAAMDSEANRNLLRHITGERRSRWLVGDSLP